MDASTKAIDSLLNYETVKYFGNERWESSRFDRSMERFERASIQHLQLACDSELRPGLHFHGGHGARDDRLGARCRAGKDDGWRFRDGERGVHPALSAAQRHGHDLSRDQTGARRHRGDVHIARPEARGKGQAGRKASDREQGRDPVRERLFRLRGCAPNPARRRFRGAPRVIWSRWSGHRARANPRCRGCFIASTM